MKARFAALGVVLLGAGLMLFTPLRADFLTPTALSSGVPSPVGIDWNSLTNQLIVSVNWENGEPLNYNSIDRVSGAQAPWGSQHGWVDEIYFATVRSGQPGGWTEGRVYSAEGVAPPAATRTEFIAEFDQNGVLLNGSFATLAGEKRLKRGGITFDRFNVPGLNGAMVVLASNDVQGEGRPDFPDTGTGVYKITSGGVVTKLAELPGHSEGVAVIPNDAATYGAWAGKILIGREPSLIAVAIDPLNPGAPPVPYNVGFEVEDIWVIPNGADFYGVDHRGGEPTGTVYRIEAAQWKQAGLVGKVVFAQENGARLAVAQSPAEAAQLILDVNPPIQWEHITFAPAPQVREAPVVNIVKFTNGADADDPNGADVPNIVPGSTVTWTYKVSNIGDTSVPQAQVLVTDSVTGLSPAFDSVFLGDADTIFEPNEIWIYKATGPALDLTLPPPAGATFVNGSCTHGKTEPERTAYTNIGRVTIPGATDTNPSSYCNPPPSTARVTGGGSIFATIDGVPNIRVTHGLQLRCDSTDKRQSLEINWDKGNNFHLDKIINSVTCYDDPLVQPPPPPNTIVDTYAGNTLFNGKTGYHGFGYAVGTGTCNKLPATIYFILSDAGEPGTADVAEYHITGGCTLDAAPALIDKGNHQFHKN